MISKELIKEVRECGRLPNGCTLYVRDDIVGGREYFTDENGIETLIWSTSLVSQTSVIAALNEENKIQYIEDLIRRKYHVPLETHLWKFYCQYTDQNEHECCEFRCLRCASIVTYTFDGFGFSESHLERYQGECEKFFPA